MKKHHDVSNIRFERNCLLLNIDGIDREYRLEDHSTVLFFATEQEKNTFEISPSGYGIYWPLIDEDLSIDGLLGVSHHPMQKTKTA